VNRAGFSRFAAWKKLGVESIFWQSIKENDGRRKWVGTVSMALSRRTKSRMTVLLQDALLRGSIAWRARQASAPVFVSCISLFIHAALVLLCTPARYISPDNYNTTHVPHHIVTQPPLIHHHETHTP
jgi:hypothetical protein